MINLNIVKDAEKQTLCIKTNDREKGYDLLLTEACLLGFNRKNSIFTFNESYLDFIYIELTIMPKSYLTDDLGNKYYITHRTELEDLIDIVYKKLVTLNKDISYNNVSRTVTSCYKEYKGEQND